VEYITQAETVFTPSLIERFDLVGMDPRGIANSSQVRCILPLITPETTLFPKTEQQFRQLLKHNREVGLNCLDKAGDLVRHMDTVSVARDHEALRLALGEDKINWLGISYGTQFYAAVVAGTFFYDYLRLASGSIWPASIAHATHNSVSGMIMVFSVTSAPLLVNGYLFGEFGILIIAAAAIRSADQPPRPARQRGPRQRY
jgi:pimeloyl-ACP methyl ester carboxylesterase